MTISLNTNINLEDAQNQILNNRYARVPNILTQDSALGALDTLENATSWHLVYTDAQSQAIRLSAAEVEGLTVEDERNIILECYKNAAGSFQYIYKYYPLIDAVLQGKITENSWLYRIVEFTNSTEFLKLVRNITQDNSIVKTDTQASYYQPGHFLNVHDDTNDIVNTVDGTVRKYAFTINLSKEWSPNWGGQLNLFDRNRRNIAEAWFPEFNTLNIFEVPALHNVTVVSPFANRGRYSILGWFLSDPKSAREDLSESN